MFLFLKLILAHLLADFFLQIEELYRLKVQSIWGHIFHVLIHGAVTFTLLYPYLNEPVIWFFVIGLLMMHLVQDFIKYTLTKKIPKNTFLYFMADQFVHLFVIGLIFMLPVSCEVRGFPGHPLLNDLYTQNIWTLNAIFLILLTLAASYTFFAFYQSYRKNARPDHGITSLEIIVASLERILVGGTVLWVANPVWVLVTPLAGILRLPFKKMRDRVDFLVSITYAVLLGLLFRIFR